MFKFKQKLKEVFPDAEYIDYGYHGSIFYIQGKILKVFPEIDTESPDRFSKEGRILEFLQQNNVPGLPILYAQGYITLKNGSKVAAILREDLQNMEEIPYLDYSSLSISLSEVASGKRAIKNKGEAEEFISEIIMQACIEEDHLDNNWGIPIIDTDFIMLISEIGETMQRHGIEANDVTPANMGWNQAGELCLRDLSQFKWNVPLPELEDIGQRIRDFCPAIPSSTPHSPAP